MSQSDSPSCVHATNVIMPAPRSGHGTPGVHFSEFPIGRSAEKQPHISPFSEDRAYIARSHTVLERQKNVFQIAKSRHPRNREGQAFQSAGDDIRDYNEVFASAEHFDEQAKGFTVEF